MTRLDAIRAVIDQLDRAYPATAEDIGTGGEHDTELVIHANGAISRESFFCRDRKANFYLLGSMGLASSVGLGIALNQPSRPVIILDGDGNILMGLGNLALVGALKPANFIHVVLDNEVYGTTGNQPTISPLTPLYRMAAAAGYPSSCLIETAAELSAVLCDSLQQPGPHFIQVKVSAAPSPSSQRIPYPAQQIKERFMSCLGM